MPQALPSEDRTASAAAADWSAAPLGGLTGRDEDSRRAFLRMVSHELRTPLNSIIGFSEILKQELYGPLGAPAYVEYAGIIKDSGEKLLNLFNSFIEIIRLEGNSHGYEPVLEPVLPALEQAVAKLRTVARAHGVTIDIRLIDAGLQAVYDPRGLAAALDQLLQNALDFTDQGGHVEVDATARGGFVDVTVFNRGDAPDPADIERLMRPFEQGTRGLGRNREGAGLGWAIVRLNAQAMGGAFTVESRAGECLLATLRLNRTE